MLKAESAIFATNCKTNYMKDTLNITVTDAIWKGLEHTPKLTKH